MPTVYDCMTCEDKPHFDLFADMVKHIKDVHGVKDEHTKCTLKPLVFLDGAGWHQQVHEMDFGTFQIKKTWNSK